MARKLKRTAALHRKSISMYAKLSLFTALLVLVCSTPAHAVTSAELYTNQAYQYGRFSARIQFAPGSGVVSSFFLWKDGSEIDGVFWNELDFEKLEAECRVETNTIYGDPQGIDPERLVLDADLCGAFHIYTYEWTPEYIAWSVDGVEIRRETGAVATAFSDNTTDGMQLRFNVWPGDATFGGEFDPSVLPVYQYIDWVEYSAYANGDFQVPWREDFSNSALPSGWSTASWGSPKNLSTHAASNVGIVDGYVVLSLTTDDAPGLGNASPRQSDTAPTPADPAAPPTNPAAPPTNPAMPPTNPATPPTDPAMPPTNPATPPTNPATPPTNPAAPPTPTEPTSTEPALTPSAETPTPTTVVSNPTDPASTPTTGLAPDAPAAIPQTEAAADNSGCSCRLLPYAPRPKAPTQLLVGLVGALGVRRVRRARRQ